MSQGWFTHQTSEAVVERQVFRGCKKTKLTKKQKSHFTNDSSQKVKKILNHVRLASVCSSGKTLQTCKGQLDTFTSPANYNLSVCVFRGQLKNLLFPRGYPGDVDSLNPHHCCQPMGLFLRFFIIQHQKVCRVVISEGWGGGVSNSLQCTISLCL